MTNKILTLRRKIDKIDIKLLRLLEQRFTLTGQIGAAKKKSGIPIKDMDREQEILQKIEILTPAPRHPVLKKIYSVIMKESRKGQRK